MEKCANDTCKTNRPDMRSAVYRGRLTRPQIKHNKIEVK